MEDPFFLLEAHNLVSDIFIMLILWKKGGDENPLHSGHLGLDSMLTIIESLNEINPGNNITCKLEGTLEFS